MVQLKGNLIPTCGQRVQHPRVIFVAVVTSTWVTVRIFSILPATSAYILKISALAVNYRSHSA